ncbi:2-aminoadipate transaminase [Ephemeroptericola cinctiostellae]|uniref:2-aminoadipate transaminase n=2 Tax=Ephemeroptericola cinctiostellae TaxID=2268024 RepID=A0A345DDD9_9BURK|nr:2-aminoadipate transaminase [Ephemeroptericola cinctiostellae]
MYQVGINTAYKALQTLEDLGVIFAEQKSGYVVCHPKASTHSNAGTFSFSHDKELTQRATIIRRWAENSKQAKVRMDLATGEPELYPTRELQAASYKVIRSNPSVLTKYALGAGLFELRKKIASRYNKLGCQLKAEDILMTNGATHALTLALQATTTSGDWVLVESPTYFGFLQILESLKLNVVSIAIDPNHGLEHEHLVSVIEQSMSENIVIKACLLQANFQNPTGCSIKPSERSKILETFYQNQIVVVEDDTFGELPHDSPHDLMDCRPPPLKAKDTHNNVILCSSLSKLISPGLRIGFINGAAVHEQIKTLHHATSIGCTELTQRIISQIYPRKFNTTLGQLREYYKDCSNVVRALILKHFPSGTSVTLFKGGYLLWVTLPEDIDTNRLFDRALAEHGISFAPGSIFSLKQTHQHALRINCSSFGKAFNETDIEHLGALAHSFQESK